MQKLHGIEKYLINHINRYDNMKYAVGHAFNMNDMFMNFPFEKLKLTQEDCMELNNNPKKKEFVKKIFRDCVRLVIDDVIDNNTTFILPLNRGTADIHMRRTFGEQFKKARQRGKWRGVDFLSSNFSGNEIILRMNHSDFIKEKVIYVDKKRRDRITKNTNEGMQYC
nr:MAG TPA: hypothetical protein [Caudoviricetes sp.]